MRDFGCLIDKIRAADFMDEPFRHIYIEEFFDSRLFEAIIQSPQVALRRAQDDQDLLHLLTDVGYEAIVFPGTTTNLRQYVRWHKKRKSTGHTNIDTCEGFGVTLRLKHYKAGSTLEQLNAFFNSAELLAALHDKFSLDGTGSYPDNGLQKYLDGYEISPHPDIRRKALTYMINVNPAPASESIEYHTHFLRFVPQREFIGWYWRGNPQFDRCWVPWEWCETVKMQRSNNSIVIFAPSDDTLHAVRAAYNHLETQRTQFYGNLWYRDCRLQGKPSWRDFEIGCTPELTARRMSGRRIKQELQRMLPLTVPKWPRRTAEK